MRYFIHRAYLLCFIAMGARAQGPALSLVGGSPSFSKGSINTEVLAQVIQQKQGEVKKRVFKNLVVAQFKGTNYTNHLNNFTTYYYIYNLMDVITSGKNKTSVTKQIIGNTAEFAYVYGLTALLRGIHTINPGGALKGGIFDFTSLLAGAAVTPVQSSLLKDKNNLTIPKADLVNFNVEIDMVPEILLNNPSFHQDFTFSESSASTSYSIWHDADNAYLSALATGTAADKSAMDAARKSDSSLIAGLAAVFLGSQDLSAQLKKLESDLNATVSAAAKSLVDSWAGMDNVALQAALSGVSGSLSDDGRKTVTTIQSWLGQKVIAVAPLIQFYQQLKKSNFQDFTLNQAQFYALKFIVTDFLGIAKNQFKNDVLSSVIEIMLDNTQVEYQDDTSGLQVTEQKATPAATNGYLYVDIESPVSAIEQHFSASDKKGVYFQLLFSIGANQASFLHDNTLTADKSGMPASLKSLYFASEKIGFEYKLWNWAYTHSFSPGESFSYYNSLGTYRSWRTPQPQPPH